MSPGRSVERATSLHGEVRVPGDKSASHRALMLSALGSGPSTIEGLSPGDDVASTSAIVQQLGAQRHDERGLAWVVGPEDGLRASRDALNCGNSGTSMRLLAGIVSSIEGSHLLCGDESLSRRPMDRVAAPLSLMGARISGRGDRITAPLHIEGRRPLEAIEYRIPEPSAQVKSAILLAALAGSGTSTVHESVRTRTTTEDMMGVAGLSLESIDVGEGRRVTLTPGRPRATRWVVPGDPSQAAFFAVLGAIHPEADIAVTSIDRAPERVGFVEVLVRMGARVHFTAGVDSGLRAASSTLVATEILSREIPSVDEVPILTVAAAAANGVSAFRAMGELRVKESDRFEGSLRLAAALGCRVWDEGDDFFIEGLGSATNFLHFEIDSRLDHRMVMSAAVAGLAGAGCEIVGASTVTSSYPSFFDDVASLQ